MKQFTFEYHSFFPVQERKGLEDYLKDVWDSRFRSDYSVSDEEEKNDLKYQPFLKFDGNKAKAQNYIGFIQQEDKLIEIYPKVFRRASEHDKGFFLKHVFFWFEYCRRLNFPLNKVALDKFSADNFPELLIRIFSMRILKAVSESPMMLYQENEEQLQFPRGKINFQRYLNESYSRGNHHLIDCDTEPFVLDNNLNRIIKFCSRLLLSQAKQPENISNLQDVLFILDEVSDVSCSERDLDKIKINPLYQDYEEIIGICRTILSSSLYTNDQFQIDQWSFLLPMEYVFEDFIAGFLSTSLPNEWKVEYQKSDLCLAHSTDGNVFNMQHDIFLSKGNQKILIDTKYKLRPHDFKTDKKRGIAQSDLYQMVSYAVRRGCNQMLLLYPNLQESLNEPDYFTISSGFPGQDKIQVIAAEVPFWSLNDFAGLPEKLRSQLITLVESQ